MTARDLQVRLQQDLTELFKDRRYKTPDGKMEPVHVFRQNLPQRKSEEDEDPFPYITVVLDSGGVKDQMTAHKIAVVFRIGIYDEDLTNQGHASVLEIMEVNLHAGPEVRDGIHRKCPCFCCGRPTFSTGYPSGHWIQH